MKATMEFDLYEERDEFDEAVNGRKYKMVLWNMDQYLRGKLKYEDLPEGVEDALQKTRDKLHELADDEGVEVG